MEPQTDRRKGTIRSQSIILLSITVLIPQDRPCSAGLTPKTLRVRVPGRNHNACCCWRTSPGASAQTTASCPQPRANKPGERRSHPTRPTTEGFPFEKPDPDPRTVPFTGVLRPPQPSPFHLQADFMMEQKRQSTVQPSARQHPQSALASWAAFQSIIYNT